MKRVMTTSVVAGLLSTLGFAPAVSAEGTLYGSVRSGVYMLDPQMAGMDTQWDIGSVDAGDIAGGDRLWSRIGVRASHELDGGMMAGLHVEKRLDNFRTRHQNVWLGGGFGRLTFGQQGSAYYSATTWDGTNLFGDWNRVAGSRVSGIKYSSGNLGGPFTFDAMVLDSVGGGHTDRDGVNAIQLAGKLATHAITLSAGYMNVGEDCMDDGMDDGMQCDDGNDLYDNRGTDWFGGSASGAVAGLDWDVGFELGDAAYSEDDVERYGFTVGYTVGNTRAYIFYEDRQYDTPTSGAKGKYDSTFTLFGLSHTLAPGVVVIAEYQSAGSDDMEWHAASGSDRLVSNRGAVAVRVDF